MTKSKTTKSQAKNKGVVIQYPDGTTEKFDDTASYLQSINPQPKAEVKPTSTEGILKALATPKKEKSKDDLSEYIKANSDKPITRGMSKKLAYEVGTYTGKYIHYSKFQNLTMGQAQKDIDKFAELNSKK